jgi:drug/metabolite transporter (DMT)-like permease
VGAAAAFAVSIPLGKWLLGETSPFTLAGLLYLGAGVSLTVYRHVAGDDTSAPADSPAGRRRSTVFLAAAIASGGVVAPLLLFWGLVSTPAVVASLLLSLEVVLTALLAGLLFREHVAAQVWGAVVLMAAAAVVMAWSGDGWAWSKGAGAIALATFFWALDNNLTREVSGYSATRVAQIKGLVAGTVNLSIGLAVTRTLPTVDAVLLAGLVGAVGYGLSLVLFIRALRLLGSARTGSYFASAPLIAGALSVALFRESPSLRLVCAFVLVGLAAVLMATESHTHEHVHGDMVHSHWHWPDQEHRHGH